MNTTHLALSEPGGAPVTADETSPLGRRRTRGLFIRQGERERARNELTVGVEEVVQAVEPSGSNNSRGNREHLPKRAQTRTRRRAQRRTVRSRTVGRNRIRRSDVHQRCLRKRYQLSTLRTWTVAKSKRRLTKVRGAENRPKE